MGLLSGDQVDRYVLEKRLGEGGQGEVWRARDPLSEDRLRAIKLVQVGSTGASQLERIRREARQLVQLRHPSLVQCFGLFEDLHRELLGIVMEYVEAESLDQLVDDERLDDKSRLQLVAHAAHALAYVHQRSVVHRDIKLENVLVTQGFWMAPDDPSTVKLIDFGIAVKAANPNPLTQVGHIIGTPPYLAPELLEPMRWGGSAAAAAPADVFAFGILAWKVLSRRADSHPTRLAAGARLDQYASAYRHIEDSQWPGLPFPTAHRWSTFFERVLARHVRGRPIDGLELVQLLATVASDLVLRTAEQTAPTPMCGTAAPNEPTPRTGFTERCETPKPAVRTIPGEPPVFLSGPKVPRVAPIAAQSRSRRWMWLILSGIGVGSFVALCIGLGAAWFVFGYDDGGVSLWPAASADPTRPGTGPGGEQARRSDRSPVTGSMCSGCDRPGTVCEADRCRLAPRSRWKVRPFALRRGPVNDATAYKSFALCLRPPDAYGWTCSEPKNAFATEDSGDAVYYFSKKSIPVVLTREQIEQEGIDIQVTLDGEGISYEHSRKPKENTLIAGERLFSGGLKFGISGRYVKDTMFALEYAGAE